MNELCFFSAFFAPQVVVVSTSKVRPGRGMRSCLCSRIVRCRATENPVGMYVLSRADFNSLKPTFPDAADAMERRLNDPTLIEERGKRLTNTLRTLQAAKDGTGASKLLKMMEAEEVVVRESVSLVSKCGSEVESVCEPRLESSSGVEWSGCASLGSKCGSGVSV